MSGRNVLRTVVATVAEGSAAEVAHALSASPRKEQNAKSASPRRNPNVRNANPPRNPIALSASRAKSEQPAEGAERENRRGRGGRGRGQRGDRQDAPKTDSPRDEPRQPRPPRDEPRPTEAASNDRPEGSEEDFNVTITGKTRAPRRRSSWKESSPRWTWRARLSSSAWRTAVHG